MLDPAQFYLSAGSHEPGEVNDDFSLVEAAVVVAGFERRPVRSADDCPPCFSRVLVWFAIHINNRMPDDLRNELLPPFITRLANTAASEEIEDARLRFIWEQSNWYLEAPGGLTPLPRDEFGMQRVRDRMNPQILWRQATWILDKAIRIGNQ
jgi:hypothetical protein